MTARIVAPFLVVFVLSGCGQAGDLVDQARDIQEQVQEQVENVRWCSDVIRLATAVQTTNVAAASNLVAALERTAPEDLAADVEVVRGAVREIEAGNAQAEDLSRDDVTAAVERLVEAVEQRCAGVMESEFGGS